MDIKIMRENLLSQINGNKFFNDTGTIDAFSIEIEQYAISNKFSLLESILHFMDKYKLEFENIENLISNTLKDKIAAENNIGIELKTVKLDI